MRRSFIVLLTTLAACAVIFRLLGPLTTEVRVVRAAPVSMVETNLAGLREQVSRLQEEVRRQEPTPPAARPEQPRPAGRAPVGRRCISGCSRIGNCNELMGECACGLAFSGPSCSTPTMPACTVGPTGDTAGPGAAADEVINLSWLASEEFWWQLRDITAQDARRKAPLYRWAGPVPCACVLQALAVFSLTNAPIEPQWPQAIGHSELAMQRLACVDTPLPAGELWRGGPVT